MPELSYRHRAHPFARERTFRLGDDALEITDGVRSWSVGYGHFKLINSLRVRFVGASGRYRQWNLHPVGGRPIVLCGAERRGFRVVDRSDDMGRFARELRRRIVAANAGLYTVFGHSALMNRAGRISAKVLVGMLRLIRRTNPDRWADATAAVMRRIGPRLRGHRRAMDQLALAFPEKPHAELQRIAVGMWDNVARTMVEYAQLDRLWDHDPARPTAGRIVMDEASARIWRDIKAANRPALIFSMHSANWELAGIATHKHGYKILIPFRRTKSEALTNELIRIRTESGFSPLPAGAQIISEIRREFREGTLLGMVIDQYYPEGVEVTMFGHRTRLNPLFARFARIYDRPIYGCRVIRLPGRRFRYQIVGPIEPARDERGRVDPVATMQSLATIMEGWIREHPEQWLWLHHLWR